MRVARKNVVDTFLSANPQHAIEVEAWLDTAAAAAWSSDSDVAAAFPAASNSGAIWVFLLKSGVLIEAIVTYSPGVVSIRKVS